MQILLHGGLRLGSFLIQRVHIFEYERGLLESNEVVYVRDTITLVNAQLEKRVVHKTTVFRYKIADEFRRVRLLCFVHDIVFLSVHLDSIGVDASLLYGEEWQVIELIVQLYWCLNVTLDEESMLAECLQCINHIRSIERSR